MILEKRNLEIEDVKQERGIESYNEWMPYWVSAV